MTHPLAVYFGTWEGDDADEVAAIVKDSRTDIAVSIEKALKEWEGL